MASTGRGDFPFNSLWLSTPAPGNWPFGAARLYQAQLWSDTDPADGLVWSDFFFEAAPVVAAQVPFRHQTRQLSAH